MKLVNYVRAEVGVSGEAGAAVVAAGGDLSAAASALEAAVVDSLGEAFADERFALGVTRWLYDRTFVYLLLHSVPEACI